MPAKPVKRSPKEAWWSLATPPARSAALADARYELMLVFRTQWRSFRGAMKASPEMAWANTFAAVLAGPGLLLAWVLLFFGARATASVLQPGPADAQLVTVSAMGILIAAAALSLTQSGTILTHSATIPLLFTLPLRSRSVLFGLVMQQAAFSLWAPFLATAPALGLLAARGAALAGLVPVICAALAVALALTAIGVFLGATVVRLIPGGLWQEWTLLLSTAGALVGFYLTQIINMDLQAKPDPLAQITAIGRWLPSWSPLGWIGGVAGLAARGHSGTAWLAGVGALAGGLLLGWGLVNLLDRMYQSGLAASPAGVSASGAGAAKRQLVSRTGWRGTPLAAMLRREWRRMVRSPRLFGLPLAMTAPMIIPLMIIPDEVGSAMTRGAVPFALSLGAAVTALSAVGAEEKAFWLTRLSPMTSREIVQGKAGAIWSLFTSVGVAIALGLALFTGLPAWQAGLMTLHTSLAVAAATAIGLGGGCADPAFTPITKQQYAGVGASVTAIFGALAWVIVHGVAYVLLVAFLPVPLPKPFLELALSATAVLLNLPVLAGILTGAARALSKVEFK